MKKKYLKKGMVGIIILIVLLEIGLRLFYSEKLVISNNINIYQPDSLYGFSYIPNSKDIRIKPSFRDSIFVNSQGFLGNDFETEKKDGYKRIVIVGASNSAGTSLGTKKRFTQFLQDIFNSKNIKVEVLNCAIDTPGNILLIYERIKNQFIDFHPDAVLVEKPKMPIEYKSITREIYNNYLMTYPFKNKAGRKECVRVVDNMNDYRTIVSLCRSSYIFRFLLRQYWNHFRHENHKIFNYMFALYRNAVLYPQESKFLSKEESSQQLLDLKNYMNNKESQLYFFDFVSNLSMAKDYKIEEYYDLINLKLDFSDDANFVEDDAAHFSEKAHQKMAEQLYLVLMNHNLIFKKE